MPKLKRRKYVRKTLNCKICWFFRPFKDDETEGFCNMHRSLYKNIRPACIEFKKGKVKGFILPYVSNSLSQNGNYPLLPANF